MYKKGRKIKGEGRGTAENMVKIQGASGSITSGIW